MDTIHLFGNLERVNINPKSTADRSTTLRGLPRQPVVSVTNMAYSHILNEVTSTMIKIIKNINQVR